MRHLILLSLLFVVQPAFAAMSLDKIIVYLNDQPNSREDIVVTNPDKETLYLQTEIYRVDNPGLADEQRVRVVDPKEFKLLVSPAKAIVNPGERKRFRLMSLERDLDTEKVYRLTIKPVVGDIKSDRSALKILVAYQALIFIEPEGGKYQLGLQQGDQGWEIRNTGNINAEIIRVKHCLSKVDCTELKTSGRVYAGAALQIDQPLTSGYLDLLVRSGSGSEKITLPVSP